MTTTPLAIGIAGALGRMGRAVAAIIEAREGMEVSALTDRWDATGDLPLVDTATAFSCSSVMIDFTSAEASTALAEAAAAKGAPALVIGSTGWTPEQEARVAFAAKRVAIVKSGNFSLGVNVLMGLVQQASAALAEQDFDIEVFEGHHRRKVDAPSGTALMLGRAAAKGRGVSLADKAVRGRDGITGAREQGTIGFSVLRGGGIIGEHSVVFASDEEILTLSHSARDRSLFARGAVHAATWAVGRPPGLYDMLDVLGFRG